jgi:hypothetical protein
LYKTSRSKGAEIENPSAWLFGKIPSRSRDCNELKGNKLRHGDQAVRWSHSLPLLDLPVCENVTGAGFQARDFLIGIPVWFCASQ